MRDAPMEGSRPGGSAGGPDAVGWVEYSEFPRATHAHRAVEVNATRDRVCIATDTSEPSGALLRVVVRDLDDRVTRDFIARVRSCRLGDDGRHRIWLDVIAERPSRMRFARPVPAARLAGSPGSVG